MKCKRKCSFFAVIALFVLMIELVIITTHVFANTGLYVSDEGRGKIESVLKATRSGRHVIICANTDKTEFDQIVRYVYDEPATFWISSYYKAFFLGDFSLMVLDDKYDDLETKQAEIDRVVDTFIATHITDAMDEFEKVLVTHDWLCNTIEYKQGANKEDQDVYGALVLKQARCAGYAKAFTYVLRELGIQSQVISGTADGGDGQLMLHAWNVVQIDGNQYCFDITWDDDVDTIAYNWFGVNAEEFQKSHFAYDVYM